MKIASLKSFLLVFTLLFTVNLRAGVEPDLWNNITGGGISVGAKFTIYDQEFLLNTGAPNPSANVGAWNLRTSNNSVTLMINQLTINDCSLGQFSTTIEVDIKSKDENGTSLPTVTKFLTIDYDNTLASSYKDKHSFTFSGAYWTEVQVKSISNPAVNTYVTLESRTTIERYQDISLVTLPAFTAGSYDATTHELSLFWGDMNGAEEYDLEWTWIDDYDANFDPYSATETPVDAASLDWSFVDNATRVTVSSNSYTISPNYERGWLLVRVRAVGKNGVQFTHRVEGPWSSDAYGQFIQPGFITDNDAFYIQKSAGTIVQHESHMNWQYSVTFAERGKKKEVISYFDGSLHNRQSVTRLNTEEKAMVGEQIYDHQGRPVVFILPVPDFGANNLEYRHDFNRADGSLGSYNRSDFDLSPGACDRSIASLDENHGAGLYYSQNNPWVTNMHYEYIASADKFPFSITEYTSDNTGRIRRQGGVGPTHQLGSGHETSYFYGTPEQEELDRLFGTNVGYKEHYEKEMVVDPNGQVSVSYKNASGKVIATALAGNTPANMQQIGSNTGSVSKTSNLQKYDNIIIEHDGNTTLSKTFLVEVQGDYTFDYTINIPRFSDANLPGICADCVYELEISLIDDCGNEQLDGDPVTPGNQSIIRTIGKPLANYDVSCESGPLSYSFSTDADLGPTVTAKDLAIGSYTIKKTLKIDENAVAYYSQYYIDNSASINSEQYFIDLYMGQIDYSQCDMTCTECQTNLGTLQDFLDSETLKMTNEGIVVTTEHTDQLTILYQSMEDECNKLCDGVLDNCDILRSSLLADISPGGQYALISVDANGNMTYSGILNKDIPTAGSADDHGFNYRYHWDGGTKTKIDYSINSQPIIINIDGVSYLPGQLTSQQFVEHFSDDIAAVLVEYHPEYCKWERCTTNRTSEQYEQDMLSTNSYQDALTKGYLNPTNDVNVTEFTLGEKDPFWTTYSSEVVSMQNLMNSYRSANISDPTCNPMSMWDLAIATYICKGTSKCSDMESCVAIYDWSDITCEPYLDVMWAMFRASYLSEKQKKKESIAAYNYNCVNSSYTTNMVLRAPTSADAEGLIDNPNDFDDINMQVSADLSAECEQNCIAQADGWMDILSGCSFSSQPDEDNFKQDLIDVCEGGCDDLHIMGASSIAPNSTNTYNSFSDVFDYYVSNTLVTEVAGVCDINLISSPMPYDHNYNGIDQNSSCVQLTNSSDQCVTNEPDEDLKRAMMQTMPQDSGSCDKCIGCDELYEAIDHLQGLYGNNFFDNTINLQKVSTKVLNEYLNFNLSYEEYVAFTLQCLGLEDTVTFDAPLRNYFLQYNYLAYASPVFNSDQDIQTLAEELRYASNSTKWWNIGVNQSPLLATQSSAYQLMASSDPDSFVSLEPCMCNLLQQEWDVYINGGGDPNDPTAFNTQLSDACYEITQAPVFDFYSLLQICQDAYVSDGSVPLKLSSVWTDEKKERLNNLTVAKDLKLPECYECSDSTPIVHPPYDSAVIVPCDSLIAFLDSLMMADPATFAGLDQEIAGYAFDGKIQNANPGVMTLFMNAFYVQFPHAYRFAGTGDPLQDLRLFLVYYRGCYTASEASSFGCCLKNNSKARRLEDLLNSMTATKGSLGNHFMYSNWDIHPDFDEYYNSILYQYQPCSTSLRYSINSFTSVEPTLHFQLGDSCGDTANVHLNYQLNGVNRSLNNDYYFGLITRFYDLTPVSTVNCDTAIHDFIVKVDQLTWDGRTITATLSGRVPQWSLKDTCRETDSLRLCDRDYYEFIPYEYPCVEDLEMNARYQAKVAYDEYIEEQKYDFERRYRAKCRENVLNETFTMTRNVYEYHYTLYYYDQAGNLVQTVPPKGVNMITSQITLDDVIASRDNSTSTLPTHTFETKYQYNTLNQLLKETTPDASSASFWYDNLGRMVVSQNYEQKNHDDYSYTLYDALGRIEEVGQLETIDLMDWTVAFYPTQLNTFISNATSREQVTQTFYDDAEFSITYLGFSQINLRKRVASMTYEESYDGSNSTYDRATHYSYDIHGNVSQLIRENQALSAISQDNKLILYTYELVSGNVNSVYYQPGQKDQFIHKYEYDADNRIIKALTSADWLHYDKDAEYYYYMHGPLMRTEIGELSVQGVDYAYSIHGWLKGVNSNTLDMTRDIGKDGQTGVNSYVAKDIFGYSLGYYEGDYTSIGVQATTITQAKNFLLATNLSTFGGGSPDLFNGNIKHMVTAIEPFMGSNRQPQGMVYSYDQLNRIKSATGWNNLDATANAWLSTGSPLPDYSTAYTYDPNGNIMSLNRKGAVAISTEMDDLVYTYKTGTNQLDYVDDLVNATASAAYPEDLEAQTAGNYSYDNIGHLIQDVKEEIETISWTVYGKVKKITRYVTSDKPDLEFEYTPDGHRSMKKVYVKNPGGGVSHTEETYYVRDASGNIMSTYSMKSNQFSWESSMIYGSSRVGVYEPEKLLVDQGAPYNDGIPADEIYFYRGLKRYEMSNHLGNVLAVVSDKRTLICVSGTQYYEAEIITAQDYYPFGMRMPNRTYTVPNTSYRFGFQGQEGDNEHVGTGNSIAFRYRIHDARIGRFFAIDPLYKKFAYNSPYAFSENRVLDGIEFEGLEVLAIQINGTVSVVLSGTYDAGIAIDVKTSQVHIMSSGGFGLESNVSVAAQMSITYFPMPKTQVKDLEGFGGLYGVSGGEGVVASGNHVWSPNGDFGINTTLGVGVGVLPVSGSAYLTYTGISPLGKEQKGAVLDKLNLALTEINNTTNELELEIGILENNLDLRDQISTLEYELELTNLSKERKAQIQEKTSLLEKQISDNLDLAAKKQATVDELKGYATIIDDAIKETREGDSSEK